MEDDGIFYGHMVHFTVFCYILWTFGIVRGNLVYFSRFEFFTKKNLATLIYTELRGYSDEAISSVGEAV
jgi:hypothetical protein